MKKLKKTKKDNRIKVSISSRNIETFSTIIKQAVIDIAEDIEQSDEYISVIQSEVKEKKESELSLERLNEGYWIVQKQELQQKIIQENIKKAGLILLYDCLREVWKSIDLAVYQWNHHDIEAPEMINLHYSFAEAMSIYTILLKYETIMSVFNWVAPLVTTFHSALMQQRLNYLKSDYQQQNQRYVE